MHLVASIYRELGAGDLARHSKMKGTKTLGPLGEALESILDELELRVEALNVHDLRHLVDFCFDAVIEDEGDYE